MVETGGREDMSSVTGGQTQGQDGSSDNNRGDGGTRGADNPADQQEPPPSSRGANNGILSGLVAVTAGAPLVDPEGAFVIGVVSAMVYYVSANLLLRLKIDDVVDAVRPFL